MEPTIIEKQLTELIADQKKFIARADDESKANGTMHTETKAALDAIRAAIVKGEEKLEAQDATLKETQAKQAKSQTQLDAIDAEIAARAHGGGGGAGIKSPGEIFTASERYLSAKASLWRKNDPTLVRLEGSAFPLSMMERKATITSGGLGAGTSGISMPSLLVGSPLEIARQELRIRSIMRATQLTTGYTYYFLKQKTRTNAASPQVEAEAKAESTYDYETVSGDVKTIAHYTKVTRQALDDVSWLRGKIDGELLYGLLLKEEAEIIAGSGAGEHLNGLVTQATAYDTAYNVASDTKLDKLRHMKLQGRLAGLATFAPDGIVMNPRDMHDIELIKTEEGAANKGLYIVGDPRTGSAMRFIWGLPVVESDSIAYGHFLVGAFGTAAEIVDRMAATVDISFENEDDFIKNKATIRAEERVGLAVERPTAFIYS